VISHRLKINPLRTLFLAGICLSLTACGDGERICNAALQYAVKLMVTDQDGADLNNFTVQYQIDGGEVQTISCASSEFCFFGFGAGEYFVTANKDGFVPNSGTVTVVDNPNNSCEVIAGNLTIILRTE